MVRGMPGGMQAPIGLLPCPPDAMLATLASKMAWYSAVSGACCPRPVSLRGSNEPAPARIHCPLISGYFVTSCAPALATAQASAASASKDLISMALLRSARTSLLRRVEIAQIRHGLV